MKASDVWENLVTGTNIIVSRTEKVHFPNWVRVSTTKAALVVEERSWRRPDSAVLNCTKLLRYDCFRCFLCCLADNLVLDVLHYRCLHMIIYACARL